MSTGLCRRWRRIAFERSVTEDVSIARRAAWSLDVCLNYACLFTCRTSTGFYFVDRLVYLTHTHARTCKRASHEWDVLCKPSSSINKILKKWKFEGEYHTDNLGWSGFDIGGVARYVYHSKIVQMVLKYKQPVYSQTTANLLTDVRKSRSNQGRQINAKPEV
jgi:hypothetical protein